METEEEFPCLYCHDMFGDAEDYKNHLRHIHKVAKKLDEGVLVAKKKAGIPVICQFVEEITIDDDDMENEENISITDIETEENVLTNEVRNKTEENVLTNEVRSNSGVLTDIQVSRSDWEDVSTRDIFELDINAVEKFAKISSANLFRQSRQILLSEKGEIQMMDEDQDNLVTDHDMDIFFEQLRNKISDVNMTKHLQCEDTAGRNKSIAVSKSSVAQALTAKSSIIETSYKRRTRQTLFLCPLGDCPDNFSTSRAGMEGGEAARHLNTRHGVTPAMVTPGRYKFRKIKVSKDSN